MDRMNWNTRSENRATRLARAANALGADLTGKCVAAEAIATLLEAGALARRSRLPRRQQT
ncbi:hypothetical protein [Variovorax fucosicus]|uniref:hypothetical protein n=1 Tax=Variovorax fucosicus TaxID=3053517 RepID=UPI0040379A4C